MRRITLTIAVVAGLAGGPACDQPPQPPQTSPEECVLESEVEKTPGYPFDPKAFREQVWPVLAGSCMGAGCHDAPNGAGGFDMWAVSDDECEFASAFNAVYDHTDLRNDAKNSRVYAAVDGSKPGHVTVGDAELEVILDYVTKAFTGPVGPPSTYTLESYQTEIDPLFTKSGCVSGCHDPEAALGGFVLYEQPAPGSDEMQANFDAVVSRIEVQSGKEGADLSRIYTRSIDSHLGVRMSAEDAEALLSWIRSGLIGTEPPPVCSDAGRFNLGVFEDEIMPILDGRLDLEDRGGSVATGCARDTCHGQARGPGKLFLDRKAPAAENLERFACFVDLENPSASYVLACPLGLKSCPVVTGHPGGDIFAGVQDRNYQRILSYLLAATASSPLDFAFYARRIDPIFNDRGAVQNGATGRTCADTTGCHGALVAGQPPSNLSNFGIIPEAGGSELDLVTNFASAANFTHFPDPGQSALFLYPTNEVANRDNPLATGLQHLGGKAFEVDDPEAEAILEWAGGLRTTDQGFQRNWLVAGDFPATEVTREAIVGEDVLQPKIFDDAGAPLAFNRGEWNGFFSAEDFIDLGDPDQGFLVENGQNRIVYAVAYVINSRSTDTDALITVTSPNDVEVFAGASRSLGLGGQVATVLTRLPSYASSRELTRIMVKVFQRPGDAQFGFDLRITDEDGNVLADELIIKLAPEGGI